MENEKKEDGQQIIVTEFEVSMHCNACERSVAKVIAKLKGVEKFTTDMNTNKVVVIGKFDPQQALKKLRKKTGKKVELVTKVEDQETGNEEISDVSTLSETSSPIDNETFMMFSDENPNACRVM